MADMGFNYIQKFVQAGVKTVDDFIKIMETLLKEHSDNAFAKEILTHLEEHGGESLNITPTKDIVAKDFAEELKKRNIPFFQCRDMANGMPVFVTKDIDQELVKEVKEAVLMKNRNIAEVSMDTLLKNNISPVDGQMKDIRVIHDISPEQMYLMKQEIALNHGVFAKKELENGHFDMFFYPREEEKMMNIYIKTGIQLHSVLGDVTRQQIQNEQRTIEYIMNKTKDQLEKNMPEGELYIVSGRNPNNVITLSQGQAEHILRREDTKNLCMRSVVGEHSELQKAIYLDITAMKDPVLMTKAQYDEYKDDKEQLRRVISEKRKEQNKEASVDFIDKSQRELAEKQRMARQLVEMKLILENEMDSVCDINLFDENISFSEFCQHNTDNMEFNDEQLARLQRMQDIADVLDSCPPEDRSAIVGYLNDTHVMINDYANEQFVEEYQPSEEDLTNNIDDFIESLQPARSVDFTKEERNGFDNKEL